jgi:hypothetical protein
LTRDLPIRSVGFPPTNAVHPRASQLGVFISLAPLYLDRSPCPNPTNAWFKDPDGNILSVVKRNFAPAEEQVRSGHDQFAAV